MADTTYKTGPTGGVRFPIIKFRTTITPKCTGSIPNFSIIGKNIGANNIIEGVTVVIIPIKSSIQLAINRNTGGVIFAEAIKLNKS